MTLEEAIDECLKGMYSSDAANTLARWKPFVLAALEQSEHADNWETDTVPNWGRVVKAYRAAVSQEAPSE